VKLTSAQQLVAELGQYNAPRTPEALPQAGLFQWLRSKSKRGVVRRSLTKWTRIS
jgi:hypothetical protein